MHRASRASTSVDLRSPQVPISAGGTSSVTLVAVSAGAASACAGAGIPPAGTVGTPTGPRSASPRDTHATNASTTPSVATTTTNARVRFEPRMRIASVDDEDARVVPARWFERGPRRVTHTPAQPGTDAYAE